jgi:7-keto-8-aminopelargonate synthetase-like enzyme
LAHELGLNNKIDIQMGTLSKAAGSEGGYICGKSELIEYLRNKSRSFIFSTAPSIPAIAASLKAIGIIENDNDLRNRLWENIDYFSKKLKLKSETGQMLNRVQDNNFSTQKREADSAILCLKFDNTENTLQISQELLEKHAIMASCIRPPTVKIPRIRLCIMTLHSK